MQPRVTHLIRTFLPPFTSFVRNQIMCHQRYQPTVGFTEKNESVLYQEIVSKVEVYHALHGSMGKLICRKLLHFIPEDEQNLIKWLKKTNPQVLHVHYGVEAVLFSSVIRKMNIPALVSFYGHDCSTFPGKYFGLGLKMLQRNVFHNPGIKMIAAMSPDMKKDLLALGCPEEKIRVHYMGTDTSPFLMERSYDNATTINFLNIGLMVEKKGQQLMIDAFVKATGRTEKKISLTIVGEGELKESLQRHISATGASNISLTGVVKYRSADHLDILRNADVFMHPSITSASGDKEGIPGAMIEAMASGLPVIATNHAGIPSIITNKETGLLVDEYDVDLLSDAILMLAEDADLRRRLGTAAKSYAHDELDIHVKEKELELMYDEIIGSTPDS